LGTGSPQRTPPVQARLGAPEGYASTVAEDEQGDEEVSELRALVAGSLRQLHGVSAETQRFGMDHMGLWHAWFVTLFAYGWSNIIGEGQMEQQVETTAWRTSISPHRRKAESAAKVNSLAS